MSKVTINTPFSMEPELPPHRSFTPYAGLRSLDDGKRWDKFEGQFFDILDPDIHTIPAFKIPRSLPKFHSIDYAIHRVKRYQLLTRFRLLFVKEQWFKDGEVALGFKMLDGKMYVTGRRRGNA